MSRFFGKILPGGWRFFQKPEGPDLDITGRGITFFIGLIYSTHTTALFFLKGVKQNVVKR